MPNAGEGFGLHLVNVAASPTGGGLAIADLEARFGAGLGDFSRYSPLMDYGVSFYAVDLDAYAAALAAGGVRTLKGKWRDEAGDTYYSLIFRVAESLLVVELVSDRLAGGDAGIELETRFSRRAAARVARAAATPNNLLYEVNVQRATSNLSAVTEFYETALNCSVTLDAAFAGGRRRCFEWGPDPTGDDWARADVCFVERDDAGAFGAVEMERNMWAVHERNIDAPPDTDKYNDFHYAVDGDGLQPAKVNGDYLSEWFAHHAPAMKDHYFYFLCTQHYIIDPTGWAIQVDLNFTRQYPGCANVPP